METPSSTRRVTRSQTSAAASATSVSTLRKIEESETVLTKSRQRNNGKQQDRSALIDITNDSPIVGLAMGNLETPISAMSKKRLSRRGKHDGTPGSGEALLRGQVKNLLQKVEEEAAELSKLSSSSDNTNRPFLHLQGFVNSPLTLAAPTPANTPQILNLSVNGSNQTNGLSYLTQSPVEENFMISQMVSEIFDGKKQEGDESENSLMITRSLLLDFSEKTEVSECSVEVTYRGEESTESKERATTDDDNSSIWSIQVNASAGDDLEEDDDEEGLDEVEGEFDEDYYCDEQEDDEEEKEDDTALVDELCDAISKIRVNGGGEWTMAKFSGKHTRFIYNSDDELEGEEEDCGVRSESSASTAASPSVLRLKGLPTPKGKHLRFPDD